MPIDANPWIGEDTSVISRIWLQTFGIPAGPDGPPLSGRSASRYMSLVAQHVDSGYAAFYSGPDQRVAVFALAFTSEAKAREALAGWRSGHSFQARSFASGAASHESLDLAKAL